MLVLELLNNISGTCIKPYNCVIESLASSLVPCYGCFTLVRDSNCFYTRLRSLDIEKLSSVSLKEFFYTGFNVLNDYFRIMFTPSRIKGDLLVRSRGRIHDLEVLINE